jgi:manganese-dependent inorganic pyrophosphatase
MNLAKLKQVSSILVTAYKNPDLDGYASIYAYTELLKKLGIEAEGAITGSIDLETKHVIKKFKIKELPQAKKIIDKAEGVILVDASDTTGIDENIKPAKVIEIIDHRTLNDIHLFKKADVTLEIVGAASTLIAEQYIELNVPMSEETVILLYAGIVSNTINFKSKLTTNRDKRTAGFLLTRYNFPPDFIEKMFKAKSTFKDKTLYEVVEENLATFKFRRTNLGIAQLEIIETVKFVQKNIDDIHKVTRKLKKKYELDHIFVKIVDVQEAKNIFVTEDIETQKILIKNFQVEFEEHKSLSHGIITRKEMAPVLKNHFEGRDFDISEIRPKDFNHFARHHDENEEDMPDHVSEMI